MRTGLTKIDHKTRVDHPCLSRKDECYYFIAFTAHAGYGYSPENSWLFNFKKPVDQRGSRGWAFKEHAIKEAAGWLIASLSQVVDPFGATLVPLPPSKTRNSPFYDDRMTRVLRYYTASCGGEVRDVFACRSDMDSAHSSTKRPGPEAIAKNICLDKDSCANLRSVIVLVDDVLTTGVHFMVSKRKLQEVCPRARIIGVFLARSVYQAGNGAARLRNVRS